jgi:chemotaxis protein CheY-P-specific phosphatase CheC
MDPAKKKRLDAMLDKLVHTVQKDSFEYVLQSFLGEELDPLMAETIIKKYKKQMDISDLDTLSPTQQNNFVEHLMQKVLGRLRTPEQMDFVRLHFYIKLSVKEGSKKLTQMLKKKVFIDTANIKKMSGSALLEFVEMINKEVFIVKVTLSDFIEGSAYVLLFRQSAGIVADLMTAGMQQDSFQEFDEVRISAVREFMNMTISSYSDAIANILSGKLFFIIQPVNPFDRALFVNEVKEQMFIKGESGFEKIFSANIDISVGGFDRVQGIMILLLEKSPEIMKTFLAKKKLAEVSMDAAFADQKKEQESEEKAQREKELVSMQKNTEQRIFNFMRNQFDDDKAKSIIENLKKQMSIQDLNTAERRQKEEFGYKLLETAFSDQSKSKLAIFQTAIFDALGLSSTAAIQSSAKTKEEELKEAQEEEEKRRKERVESSKNKENIFKMVQDDEK